MKYCGKCGAQLPDDAVFCDNCGNSFIEKTADNSSNKTSAPVTAIKINKKKGASIAAVIAAIAIALIAVYLFRYMKTYPSKLEGVYAAEQTSQDGSKICYIINFSRDGSVIYTSQPKERAEYTYSLYTTFGETRHTGTYKAKKKKLTMNLDNGMSIYDYQMTDNGLELTSLEGEKKIYLDVTDGILGQQETKFTEAEGLYANGKYSEAMPIYEALGYYYDSGEKAKSCLEILLREGIKDIVVEAIGFEQISDNQFVLRLKYTNGSIRPLRKINYTMEIHDNESLVLASFNENNEDFELEVGKSVTKRLTMTINDVAMAQRIAQSDANDIKIIYTINVADYEGYDYVIDCEDEARELTLKEKTKAEAYTREDSNKEDQTAEDDYYWSEANADMYTARMSEYVIHDSDARYLSASELQQYSAYELRLARNEIYARHGRIFEGGELAEYFNSKSWYVPSIPADQFDEAVFNAYEKANLETIKQVETQKAQNAAYGASTDYGSYWFAVCRDANGNIGTVTTQVMSIKNVSYDSNHLTMTQVLSNGEEKTGTATKYYGRLNQKVTSSFEAYAEVYSTQSTDGTTMYIDVFNEYGMIRETDSNGNELYYVQSGGVDIAQILMN